MANDAAARANEPVPDMVKQFVVYFYRHIREKNVYEILSMYEKSFSAISERYFKASSWPSAEAIARYADNDHVFGLLYKELYFRHVYGKTTPTLDQRKESWENYCNLFGVILHGNVNMQLPNLWLWEMIDEFIYQFQNFCQYKAKPKKSDDEIAILRDDQVWNVYSVLNYLEALIDKSNIRETLVNEGEASSGTLPDGSADLGQLNLFKMLGYFSMIGLLRMHVLLGDYYLGLKAVEHIDLNRKGLFTRVTACHISIYYYMGFSYMMMRRYVDAIKCFTNILLFISRTKQYHTRSYQYDQILKKNEQMYALLAISLSLCPFRIDENVHTTVREKYTDKMVRMQRCDESCFEELFTYASPKFVNTGHGDDASHSQSHEAHRQQLKMFLNEVSEQKLLGSIRSYLKLYTTISISKLALYMEMDEAELRTHLMTLKHKTRQMIWQGGSPLSCKPVMSSDVDFFISNDMITVADTKLARRYGEYFIRHITKFEEIITSAQV